MVQQAKPTAETQHLAEVMTDPFNRFYRYRVAHWILPVAKASGISPNQITYLHTAIGITAAAFVASGTDRGLIIGFVLSEIRLVLDCLDGVLARAKGVSSPYGRTLDALGDAISFLALATGMYFHVKARDPGFPGVASIMVMMAVGGLMAWVTDYYKRKFAAALKTGTDDIYDQLAAKRARIKAGEGGFVMRFGFWFDWMQVVILQSGTKKELEMRLNADEPFVSPEVPYILKNAHTTSFRLSLRAVSLMCGDNMITFMNIGLLTGALVMTQAFLIVYGIFSVGVGVLLCNFFLHGSRREPVSVPRN